MSILLTALLAISVSWSALAAESEMVSTIAGRVDKEVITTRCVHISYLIDRALEKPVKGDMALLKLESEAFKQELANLLMEWVVYFESAGFGSAKVTNKEVEEADAQVRRQLTSQGAWKELEVSATEIREHVRRKLQSKKYIRFKVDSSYVPVTTAEARAYFDNNRVKFGNISFDKFEDKVKSYLSKQQSDKRLQQWFDLLRSKYKVRNELVVKAGA